METETIQYIGRMMRVVPTYIIFGMVGIAIVLGCGYVTVQSWKNNKWSVIVPVTITIYVALSIYLSGYQP